MQATSANRRCSTPALQAAYQLFHQTVQELPPGPLHLVALSGVPVIFPKASGGRCPGRQEGSLPAGVVSGSGLGPCVPGPAGSLQALAALSCCAPCSD